MTNLVSNMCLMSSLIVSANDPGTPVFRGFNTPTDSGFGNFASEGLPPYAGGRRLR